MDYKQTNLNFVDAINTPIEEQLYKQNNLTYDQLMVILNTEKTKTQYNPKPPALLTEFLDEVENRIFDCLDQLKEQYPDLKLSYNKLRHILEKTIKVEEIIEDEEDDEYDDTEYWFCDKLD